MSFRSPSGHALAIWGQMEAVSVASVMKRDEPESMRAVRFLQ